MEDVPPAIRASLQADYPSLNVSPAWFSACYEYLAENFPQEDYNGLYKHLNIQLLASDLSTSIQPKSTSPFINLGPGKNGKLFTKPSDYLLVQVQSIDNVGVPALKLMDVLKYKREAGNIEQGQAKVEDLDEEKANLDTYPKGMSRVVLSDGHYTVDAFELAPVAGLNLENTLLGAKFLLKNIKFKNQFLLLEPGSTELIGGQVEELEAIKELEIERRLRQRLGLPPQL